MKGVARIGWMAATLLLSSTSALAAIDPYLTDEEETALCIYQVSQQDYFRDHGHYGSISDLRTGDPPYLPLDWEAQLGRYSNPVVTAGFQSVGVVLELTGQAGSNAAPYLNYDPAIYRLYGATASDASPSLFSYYIADCEDRDLNPQRAEVRMMDNLLAIAEALWLKWLERGELPVSVDGTTPRQDSYLRWGADQIREGYQYAYNSDGVDFSIAAWPLSPRKAGQRSFYCDQTGVLRAEVDAAAGPDSPVVTEGLPRFLSTIGYAYWNEKKMIQLLCSIRQAQDAYFIEFGKYPGKFDDIEGTEAPYMNFDFDYPAYGYNLLQFSRNFVMANAVEYGLSGIRGFQMETTGEIRGDAGRDAGQDSPIIGQVCAVEESFQPRGESLPGPMGADTDGDYRLSLSEVLALIQVFNMGAYHCGDSGGFAAGEGARTCAALEVDADANWSLGLDELLRGVQVYNLGAYFPCPGGEDGFCLPTLPVF